MSGRRRFSRLMSVAGASVVGLAVSAWPYLLYLLTPRWLSWSVDDLGGLPFLLIGSGFSGALVFVLMLWRRVGWGSAPEPLGPAAQDQASLPLIKS